MYIFRLGSTTSGSGLKTSIGINKNHKVAISNKKTMGSGLVSEIYDNSKGKIQRKGDILRNLKIAQPKIPKKYISFDF
jgi:hypothetical protein